MTVDTMGRKGRGKNQWMVRRVKMTSSRKAHRMWRRGKSLSSEERFRKALGDVLSEQSDSSTEEYRQTKPFSSWRGKEDIDQKQKVHCFKKATSKSQL